METQIFLNEKAYGTALLTAYLDAYGAEALEWDPATVEMELRDAAGTTPSPAVLDRLNAAMSLLTTNLFHISLEGFSTVSNALNFGPVYGDTFVPCNVEDIMWGCTEARLLEGGEDFDKQGFSHDIALFAGRQLSLEGVTKPPTLLQFAEFDPELLDSTELALTQDAFLNEVYTKRQFEARDELDRLAKFRLRDLLVQVQGLKLANGSTVNLTTMINKVEEKLN
jgi:hypothetical protein